MALQLIFIARFKAVKGYRMLISLGILTKCDLITKADLKKGDFSPFVLYSPVKLQLGKAFYFGRDILSHTHLKLYHVVCFVR